MKSILSKHNITTLLLSLTFSSTLSAQSQCTCGCNDASLPAGLMHITPMQKNTWMFGYMGMFSHSSGMRAGSHDVTNAEVFANHDHHYMAAVGSMDMEMHMFHLMYAPFDNLTISIMPQYMLMEMNMKMASGMEMSHSTSGWSDTVVAASFPLFDYQNVKFSGSLGLSLPTGDVDEKHNGHLVHYMMQHGSGTVDIIPALQAITSWSGFDLGLRYQAIVRTDNQNDSGFSFGDVHTLDAWVSREIVSDWSASARLSWLFQDDIYGHYLHGHNHSSPPDLQGNYGGSFLDVGLGVNYHACSGFLKGFTTGVELMIPLYQDVNGIQSEKQIGLNWSLQKSF